MKLSVKVIQTKWCGPDAFYREGNIVTLEVKPPIQIGEDFEECVPDLMDYCTHVFSSRKSTILRARIPVECYVVRERTGRLTLPVVVKDLKRGEVGNREPMAPPEEIALMLQNRLNDPSSF